MNSKLILVSLGLLYCGAASYSVTLAQESKTVTDVERLRGSWQEIEWTSEGITRQSKGKKLVVTEEKITLPGLPSDEVSLNEKASPKEIDIVGFKCIYKLEDDSLTICINDDGGGTDGKRPTKFESTKGQSLCLFKYKRCKEFDKNAPEIDFDKLLKSEISEAIKLLDAKDHEGFLNRFVPPPELKQMKAGDFKKALKGFETRSDEVLNTLRVLYKLKPELRKLNEGTVAIFDLSVLHVPGGITAVSWRSSSWRIAGTSSMIRRALTDRLWHRSNPSDLFPSARSCKCAPDRP